MESETSKMKWVNLKQNKCPKCDADLATAYIPDRRMFECSCGFKIREIRFSQIVSSQITTALEKSLDKEYEG
jgi:hypothetical protein